MMLPLTAENNPGGELIKQLRSLMVKDPMDAGVEILNSLGNLWEVGRHMAGGNTKCYECRLLLSAICAVRSLREHGPDAPRILEERLAAPRV